MPNPDLAGAIERLRQWGETIRHYNYRTVVDPTWSMQECWTGPSKWEGHEEYFAALALIERALAEREGEREQMQHALELPLLFHGGGPWDDRRRLRWLQITESDEATTKKMCDHIRRVLGLPARPKE